MTEIVLVDLPSVIRIHTGVTLQELVELLESLKIEHYEDWHYKLQTCGTFYGRECTCEAGEHNAKIDAMISRLTHEAEK